MTSHNFIAYEASWVYVTWWRASQPLNQSLNSDLCNHSLQNFCSYFSSFFCWWFSCSSHYMHTRWIQQHTEYKNKWK